MNSKAKHWSATYWDIVSQIYWVPPYIGLKSIPQKHWRRDGDRVSVPLEKTTPNGPLYYRLRKGDDFWAYVHRQEETFNHIFDLTFSILAGDVIAEILSPLAGLQGDHSFRPVKSGLKERYSLPAVNWTQPDAVFESENAVLLVELKFNATTSLDQLSKYIAIAMLEERYFGHQRGVSLLYVTPSANPVEAISRQLGFDVTDLSAMTFEKVVNAVTNVHIRKILTENREALAGILARLSIRATSWSEMNDRIKGTLATLSDSKGDRTLRNLLAGLSEAIQLHPLSKVAST